MTDKSIILKNIRESNLTHYLFTLDDENRKKSIKFIVDLHKDNSINLFDIFKNEIKNKKTNSHIISTISTDCFRQLDINIEDLFIFINSVCSNISTDYVFSNYIFEKATHNNVIFKEALLLIKNHPHSYSAFLAPLLRVKLNSPLELISVLEELLKLDHNIIIKEIVRSISFLSIPDEINEKILTEMCTLYKSNEYIEIREEIFKSIINLYGQKENNFDQVIEITKYCLDNKYKSSLILSLLKLPSFDSDGVSKIIYDWLITCSEFNSQETSELDKVLHHYFTKKKNNLSLQLLSDVIDIIDSPNDLSLTKYDIYSDEKTFNDFAIFLLNRATKNSFDFFTILANDVINSNKKYVLAPSESLKNDEDILRIATLVLGWCFFHPIFAYKLISGLYIYTNNKKHFFKLIENSILSNYPYTFKKFLCIKENHDGIEKSLINLTLKYNKKQNEDIERGASTKELLCSQKIIDEYHQNQKLEMEKIEKLARKQSIFSYFGEPTILLYGQGSIYYSHLTDGGKERQESILSPMTYDFESPFLLSNDPLLLQLTLTKYQAGMIEL